MSRAAPPDTSTRRRRFRLAAALLPLAALALLECGLRVAGFRHDVTGPAYRFVNPEGKRAASGDGPMIPDDALFWRLRPGFVGPGGEQHVADSGFRSPFQAELTPGVRRIVCLGDSSTFGLQVPAAAAWPAALERRLQAAGERVEVLNLGVPGYTSHQGLMLLRGEAGALRPDVVIAAFGAFNDWVPALGRTDAEQGASTPWLDLRIVQLAASMLGAGPDDDPLRGEILDRIDTRGHAGPRRVGPQAFRANLAALVAESRALGATTVLVALPLPAATLARNPIANEYARIGREVATDSRVPFVDGWSARTASGLSDEQFFADFCHPAARGHALVADEIARALQGE